ncbi:MAG TPA: hypothetical protein VGM06_06075 [Polyangiaceae bacterium]|jgi:hypothetical protein
MSDRRVSQRVTSSSPALEHEIHDEPRAPASVRAQSAVVRTLADALEQLALPGDMAVGLREQLAEELARLGSRIEEAAALDRVRDGE